MILGIGVDLAVVSRIEGAMKNPKFLPRIFTTAEIQEISDAESAAGLWAAKEAVIKAVGRKIPWKHIEVLKGAYGKPVASLLFEPGFAQARVHVSISHDGGMAMGFAVLET